MTLGKAPVERVGGTQEEGPWPSEVEEIAEGKAYNRPVRLADESVQEVEVTVTSVVQMQDQFGNGTDGYAVAFQFDDPTLDGGGG